MSLKNEKIHSELLEKDHSLEIEKNTEETFTGLCKEQGHENKLEYFCEEHNQLCCDSCIVKLIKKGKGQHTQCNVFHLQDIKNSKKKELENNIINLENISKNLEESINCLNKILEEINSDKDKLKISIQTAFTNIRNELNNREDILLSEIDKIFDEIYFKKDLVIKAEKIPIKIKDLLNKSKIDDKDWENETKLSAIINYCFGIENKIKEINIIYEKIEKKKKFNPKVYFNLEKENKNDLITFKKIIKSFGKIIIYNETDKEQNKSENISSIFPENYIMAEKELKKLHKKIEKLEEEKNKWREACL